MPGEEESEDDALGHDLGIEGDLKGFGVTGRARAHLTVVRVGGVTAGVSGDHRGHARGALVDGVEAPEAACAEGESAEFAHNRYNDVRVRLFPHRSSTVGAEGEVLGCRPVREREGRFDAHRREVSVVDVLAVDEVRLHPPFDPLGVKGSRC